MLSVATGMSMTALQWQEHRFEDILRKNSCCFQLVCVCGGGAGKWGGVIVFDMADVREKSSLLRR